MSADDVAAAKIASVQLGSALVVAAAATYGVGTTLSRLVYDGGGNPLTVVLLRSAAFALIVGIVLLLLRRRFRLPRAAILSTLWMACTLSMVSFGYQGSVAFIPVSLAALIFYTYPLLVGIVATLTGRDRMTLGKGAALIVAFAGLALTLGPSFEALDWRGVASALMASLGMTLTITFSRGAISGHDTLVMNFYTNLWMALGFAVFAVAAQGLALPYTGLGRAALGAVAVTYIIAFTTWFVATRMVPPVRLAALFNVEPLVSIFMAWLVLGERLGPIQLVGVMLVLGSIVAMTLSRAPLKTS